MAVSRLGLRLLACTLWVSVVAYTASWIQRHVPEPYMVRPYSR